MLDSRQYNKPVMTIRGLWALTALAAAFVFISYHSIDPAKLSALGGIISAAGSVLAVLWFSAGLHYQATQLKEQRKQLDEQRQQFVAQFHHTREGTIRDAINMGREILSRAKERALEQSSGPRQYMDIAMGYLKMEKYGPLLGSDAPDEVMASFDEWMKQEGPALIMIEGMKAAATVYLQATQVKDVDYNLPPEEFVYIYWLWVENKPYFSEFSGLAKMLSQFMVTTAPARSAAFIAHSAAMFKMGHSKYMNLPKLEEDLQKHIEKGYPLPKIAEGLRYIPEK